MATVSPVSFGVRVPNRSQTSIQNQNLNASIPVATCASRVQAEVPNQKSAIAVLLTAACLCSVAIVNLIKAGR